MSANRMTKKFAVVELDSYVGKIITFMDKEEFGLAMCPATVLFESDDWKEASIKYKELKNNYELILR